jgi:hypothetical protein
MPEEPKYHDPSTIEGAVAIALAAEFEKQATPIRALLGEFKQRLGALEALIAQRNADLEAEVARLERRNREENHTLTEKLRSPGIQFAHRRDGDGDREALGPESAITRRAFREMSPALRFEFIRAKGRVVDD